jgi:hypothetical protein
LRGEHRLRVSDLKGRKTDRRENFIMMNFIPYILHQMLLGWARHVACMGEGRVTGFWLGGPNGRDHQEDLGVGGRITLR